LFPAGIAFTQSSKHGFFAPQGRHVAPTNVKNFTFIGAEIWEYSCTVLLPKKMTLFRLQLARMSVEVLLSVATVWLFVSLLIVVRLFALCL